MSISEIINQKQICLTVGPGGVGKTTVAAMLGIQAAVLGRRALVITVDPAMRLADALGLTSLPAGKHKLISQQQLQREGIPAHSDLTVTMLNTGRSLKALIRREVSNPKLRKQILQHPFFKRICGDLAGSREYAATEEIHHLIQENSFDLIIVDTPPSTQALDFLDAPDRILDVLEHGSYRWLMRPALLAGRIGLKVLDFSGGYVVRTLSKFTGTSFLTQLATFVDLFSGLMEGFRQRAAAFKTILRSADSALVLITTPDPNRTDDTLFLYRKLCSRNLFPYTVVVNRLTYPPDPLPKKPEWKNDLGKKLDRIHKDAKSRSDVDALLNAMLAAHDSIAKMAERDRVHMEVLSSKLEQRTHLIAIPQLPEDIHSLSGLEKIRKAVFDPGETL